uniref:Cilia-and flagella-associated protein 96 n=1 Tax=Diabrotica virgifera virgifera TaxID=50390 RepID=A0A6P7F6E4_DIAVI
MAKFKQDKTLGAKFGRPDLERAGLFSEMPYMHGVKYPWPKPNYVKGKNFIADSLKIKTGRADCYFEKDFKRIFTGEAIKGRGRKPKPPRGKNIHSRDFIPSGPAKKHATPGDYYGTFEKVSHFSPLLKKKISPKADLGRNFLTSPGKKGGYGYTNICLNPFPTYSHNKYDVKPKYKEYGRVLGGPMVTSHYPAALFEKNPYPDPPNVRPGKVYIKPKEKPFPIRPPGYITPTGPGKTLGGCKCGGFSKFPEYRPNKYFTIWDLNKPSKHKGTAWFPQSIAEKTFYTVSVITENVRFRVNERTLNTIQPTYTKYLG